MCGLKAAEMHEQPFRATKELVQPSTAQDFVLPYGKKILNSGHLSSIFTTYLHCTPTNIPKCTDDKSAKNLIFSPKGKKAFCCTGSLTAFVQH